MSHGPQPHKWAITGKLAIAMRADYLCGGFTLKELAHAYSVSYGTVQAVISAKHPAVRSAQPLARPRGGNWRARRQTE